MLRMDESTRTKFYDVERNDRSLTYGTIPTYVWREPEKPREISVRITNLRADI